jgi:hypothetical protein
MKWEVIDCLPELIQRTLPAGPGERHRQLFHFARLLRAIPAFTDSDPSLLEPYVRQWFDAVLPKIRTKNFETSRRDFNDGWNRIRYAAGACGLEAAINRALVATIPPEADHFRSPKLRLLVCLCRELQRQHGDRQFFLSCRDAARVVGLTGNKSHVTAWKWLRKLCHEGILKLLSSGSMLKRKANEYQYLLEME